MIYFRKLVQCILLIIVYKKFNSLNVNLFRILSIYNIFYMRENINKMIVILKNNMKLMLLHCIAENTINFFYRNKYLLVTFTIYLFLFDQYLSYMKLRKIMISYITRKHTILNKIKCIFLFFELHSESHPISSTMCQFIYIYIYKENNIQKKYISARHVEVLLHINALHSKF